MNLISLLHFIFTILVAIYGLFPRNWFDYFYIYYIILLSISWTMYNGDCLISYYFMKMKNPDHKPGSTLYSEDNANDLAEIIPLKYYQPISNMLTFGFIFSFYVVCSRQKIKRYIFVPFSFAYITYIILLNTYRNLDADPVMYFVQRIFMIYFIIILYLITYNVLE